MKNDSDKEYMLLKGRWKNEENGRVPTKNSMGFMFTDLVGSTPAFLDYATQCSGTILDIGCAYGVATLPTLDNSAAHVIAFDASQEHLDELKELVCLDYQSRITYVQGMFPVELIVEDNSLDAINISYVLLFLSGEDFDAGIKKCYQVLKPGGKLFINTLSIHFCLFKHLVEGYSAKLARGDKWPGIVDKVKENQNKQEDSQHVPESINLVSLRFLEELLIRHGFGIDDSFYYDFRKPDSFDSGGKGCIAVIASKPV